MPNYLAIMQYAEDGALREKLYRAYATRASELSPAGKDNGPIIDRLLELRRQEAELLGYKNYAEVSLVPKMAQSPSQVIEFLRDLARKAKPFAKKDYEEVIAFAQEHLNIKDPQPWDLSFAAERLREKKYSYSEQEVKEYFTEPQVLKGMFGLGGKTLFHQDYGRKKHRFGIRTSNTSLSEIPRVSRLPPSTQTFMLGKEREVALGGEIKHPEGCTMESSNFRLPI